MNQARQQGQGARRNPKNEHRFVLSFARELPAASSVLPTRPLVALFRPGTLC